MKEKIDKIARFLFSDTVMFWVCVIGIYSSEKTNNFYAIPLYLIVLFWLILKELKRFFHERKNR